MNYREGRDVSDSDYRQFLLLSADTFLSAIADGEKRRSRPCEPDVCFRGRLRQLRLSIGSQAEKSPAWQG